MQRDLSQLRGPNASQYSRISFVPHSGIPGEALGFVDPSHVIRGCHLIPTFNLQRTRDRLGPSMARDAKGDWQAFYANRYGLTYHKIPHSSIHRFSDHDAFARFSGIGIGCQRLQATRTLKIVIGPDAPNPMGPITSEFESGLFEGCYKFDDDDDESL